MCHITSLLFGIKKLSRNDVNGKRVIEVGSYDVNGSLRPVIMSWEPSEYIGVDIMKGPGVDIVCNAEDILEKFGKESFDVVISTEVLEHSKDWKKTISNFKNICKPNGIILVTTRSLGFGYHAYPYDFWRYEIEDMKEIFSDCEILSLEKDPVPGVFIKVKKPNNFIEKDLKDYKLYSIITNRKMSQITDKDSNNLYFKLLKLKIVLKKFIFRIIGYIS